MVLMQGILDIKWYLGKSGNSAIDGFVDGFMVGRMMENVSQVVSGIFKDAVKAGLIENRRKGTIMNTKIEAEMVEYFIVKSKRDRTIWELNTPRKRNIGIARFRDGEYLDMALFKELSNEADDKIIKEIISLGGGAWAYIFEGKHNGFMDVKEALETARCNDRSFVYFGKGIGYYHAEWYRGKKMEYLLHELYKKDNKNG